MTTKCSPQLSRRAFLGWAAAVAAWVLPAGATAAETAQSRPLQIWFIRHAQSEINVPAGSRRIADDSTGYPLTRMGVAQAKALAATLANVPITTIYTSTYLRAVQTADALAFRHDLTLTPAPEAVEIDLGIDPESHESSRAVYMELTHKWLIEKDVDARHGAGESFADVQRRFLPFVREIMNRHAHDTGVIVIVSHSATLGLMVPVLATNVPPDFALRHPLPNTGIIRTELRDSKLLCTEWAGIASSDFTEPPATPPGS